MIVRVYLKYESHFCKICKPLIIVTRNDLQLASLDCSNLYGKATFVKYAGHVSYTLHFASRVGVTCKTRKETIDFQPFPSCFCNIFKLTKIHFIPVPFRTYKSFGKYLSY